ncbi:hypothetical protein SAMN05421504_103743 [Amycolatopsis xylanica]|uniref:Peptidase inhibitor family I36 n=1 Tax=Amycolatopsis xylanica TaxID=589385 RepID=A0A1H3EBR0_9PSEU|nr:hypothetical protein [Amycolatopsis xylanica]SDX76173.1 hypothetical protein SAMN05421504_103743 [Amycolatopsis xylanica]
MSIMAKALIGATGLGLLITPLASAGVEAKGTFVYGETVYSDPANGTCLGLFSSSSTLVNNGTDATARVFTGSGCTGAFASVPAHSLGDFPRQKLLSVYFTF